MHNERQSWPPSCTGPHAPATCMQRSGAVCELSLVLLADGHQAWHTWPALHRWIGAPERRCSRSLEAEDLQMLLRCCSALKMAGMWHDSGRSISRACEWMPPEGCSSIWASCCTSSSGWPSTSCAAPSLLLARPQRRALLVTSAPACQDGRTGPLCEQRHGLQ